MDQSIINDWVGFPIGCKELRQTNVDVDIPVGLGRGIKIVESEERYIDLTRPRLELMHTGWRSCAAAIGQLT